MASIYEEIVASIDELTGAPHEGLRAVHARGAVCEGTFTAAPEAARLSRAAFLSGDAIPVTARLSNGSGNPHLPDADRLDGRGLAVKKHLPDGGTYELGPPVSYATLKYNSLHAFALVNGDGERRWARFSWVPEAGEERLPEEEID